MKRLGNQKGVGLIEVLISVAVFGAIVVSLFIALNVSQETTFGVNRQTTAESLTRAELEYIKSCDYDDVNNPPVYGLDPNIDLEAEPYNGRYSITVTAEHLDPSGDGTEDDEGIQKITIEVYYDGELALATESYKVKR